MTGLVHDAASVVDPEPSIRTTAATVNPRSFRQTRQLIRGDLHFRCTYENKVPSTSTFVKLLRHPGVACVVLFRLQHYCYARRLSLIGWLLKFMNLFLHGVDISQNARIGPGLLIVHANTIIIDSNAIIGERCVLFHQNSITASPFYEPGEEAGPILVGNDVVFGGGAVAYGNIVIGDNTSIGTNSVVNRSFPAGSSLFGVPARVVGKRAED